MNIYKSNIIPVTSENDKAKYLITDKDKIVYVGNDIPHEYKDLEINNLENKTIVPGFFDTHTHFSSTSKAPLTEAIKGITSIVALQGEGFLEISKVLF